MAGEDNLIPLSERTKEEQREIATMGGKASGEARRRKRAMKQTLELLLSMKLKTGKECDLEKVPSFEKLKDKNITVEEAIVVKQVQKALKGDLNAAAFIRDTSGQAPKHEVDFAGAIPVVISGADDLED